MALDPLLEKYDIYYTNPSSTQMGFMLAKNKNGTKRWEKYDIVGTPPNFAVRDVSLIPMDKAQKNAMYERLRRSLFGKTTSPGDWQATTAYSLGDYVSPTTPNGYVYECITAGTSGSGEPSWPTTHGDTKTDGSVTWGCRIELSLGTDEQYQDIIVPFDQVRELHSLTLFTVGCDANRYFSVEYSIDGGIEWTSLGSFNSSPSKEIDFPADKKTALVIFRVKTVDYKGLAGKFINFHLKSVADVGAITVFVHTVRCAENMLCKKNLVSTDTFTEIQDFIDTIRDEICTLGDRDGTEHNVKVRVVHEIEADDEETKRPSRLYTLEATSV